MIDLTICICTIESRAAQFQDLYFLLGKQRAAHDLAERVELIFERDDKQMSVGRKRNRLVQRARGAYVCFVDDDDMVAPGYVMKLHAACTSEPRPDVVGFKGEITFAGERPKTFIHSLLHAHDHEDDAAYDRRPNHLNPVRREIALECPFPEIDCGEDAQYADRLQASGRLASEVFLDEVLYFYRFDPAKTETQR